MGQSIQKYNKVYPKQTYHKTCHKNILIYGNQDVGLGTLLYKLIEYGQSVDDTLGDKLEKINNHHATYYQNSIRYMYHYTVSHSMDSLHKNWDIILLVFDLACSKSIDKMHELLDKIEGYKPVIVVANKIDLADCYDNSLLLLDLPTIYPYLEVSAKSGEGIQTLLSYIHKK